METLVACLGYPLILATAELGISESAAKVRLHRARKKLRENLFPLRGESGQEERDEHAV